VITDSLRAQAVDEAAGASAVTAAAPNPQGPQAMSLALVSPNLPYRPKAGRLLYSKWNTFVRLPQRP
jgi:hypothetical protein